VHSYERAVAGMVIMVAPNPPDVLEAVPQVCISIDICLLFPSKREPALFPARTRLVPGKGINDFQNVNRESSGEKVGLSGPKSAL
jgi:hypothetical protein